MTTRKYSRKQGDRQPRQTIAIFTEGTVTEVEYLEFILLKLGIPKELVQIHPSKHSDPKGLVNDAVNAKRQNEKESRRKGASLIENWWVLADTECGRAGLCEASQKAKDNEIWLGFCDPSIEFWLLLHFQYTTQSFGDVRELTHRLRRFLPDYHAGNKHPDMATLFPKLPKAMDNAKRLRKNHTFEGYGSPRTDCDLLIAELNCQAHKGSELFPKEKPSRKSLFRE